MTDLDFRFSVRPVESAGPAAWTSGTVLAGLALFGAVWLAQLSLGHPTLPMDDIEQLTWVRSLEWGYYKHPPLPTWLLWLPVHLFGWSAATVCALGAATTLGAVAILWRLLVTLRGAVHASVAMLAALCITYYNGRLSYYNHEVVLLLLSTASAALCWAAFTTRRLAWWLGLGLALGLGALAKYQVAVTVASVLAFAIHQRAWRDGRHRLGLLLAALVVLLAFAPHLLWLRTHDFAPIAYAVDSSLGAHLDAGDRLAGAAHWLADQLGNRALPAFVLLVLAARFAHRPEASVGDTVHAPSSRALLLCWGLVPLAFMPVAGLATGTALPLHWGTPFLLFVVPAAMELAAPARWARLELKATAAIFVGIQALLLAQSQWFAATPPPAASWRAFDARQVAERIAADAHAGLGGPVQVVIGPAAYAGALALQLPEQPLVLIDGRFDRSPWLRPQTVDRRGAVELVRGAATAGGPLHGTGFPGLAWRLVKPAP